MFFNRLPNLSSEKEKEVASFFYDLINTKDIKKRERVKDSFKEKAKSNKNNSVLWSFISVIFIALSGSNLLSSFPSLSSSGIFFNVSILLFYVYILYSEQKVFTSSKIILNNFDSSFIAFKDQINEKFINGNYKSVYIYSFVLLDKNVFNSILKKCQ